MKDSITLSSIDEDIHFEPVDSPFEFGIRRIEEACDKIGFDPDAGVVTSKDAIAQKLKAMLAGIKTPEGFHKWMLPLSLPGAHFFMSIGEPMASVPPHSHDHGAGIRFIVAGSIIYNNTELTSGDWMYVPKGVKYSFVVGHNGVTLASGYYSCCNGGGAGD